MSFNKRVTTTKRNNIYLGPTESKKMSITMEEVYVDMCNVYDQLQKQSDDIDALASGYLDPVGRLRDLSAQVSEIENTFDKMVYIQASQSPTF